MAKIVNWKLVLLVIGIFSISMFTLPGVITESMAAYNPAVAAGEIGGAVTTSVLTTGSIAVGLISLGAFLGIIFLAGQGSDLAVRHP